MSKQALRDEVDAALVRIMAKQPGLHMTGQESTSRPAPAPLLTEAQREAILAATRPMIERMQQEAAAALDARAKEVGARLVQLHQAGVRPVQAVLAASAGRLVRLLRLADRGRAIAAGARRRAASSPRDAVGVVRRAPIVRPVARKRQGGQG